LRQALDDCGLADATLTDEKRILLIAAAEDFYDAIKFQIAANDGFKLAIDRRLGEILE
jgi:hypothetical protein